MSDITQAGTESPTPTEQNPTVGGSAEGYRLAEIIDARFNDELAAFNGTRGKSEIYASLRAVTEYTANEYGNRFLVELLQNGHDAHAADGTSGEIRCLFAADEGDYGTLYVANQGRPFGERDFAAICQFARSSKRPGESIGNKGIGFRSVLQICEYPEIYSARSPRAGAASFDGFCFSFARPEDLVRLVPDADLREAVHRDVPPHVLPVALTTQNAHVRSYAQAGFATVVRLPIKFTDARSDVLAAFDALVEGPAPILLFLERISRIRIETEGLPDGDWYTDVSRRRAPAALTPPDGLNLDVVELRVHFEEEEDDVERYLLVSTEVGETKMREVIETSIRADKLPSSWRGWSGPARVALATKLTGDASPGILYNYLPMGEAAAAPLLGHLDAPFYAKIDRTSLHPSVPLNDFLFEAAARVASRVALYLAGTQEEAFRDAALDLIAWDKPAYQRLATVLGAAGTTLQDAPVVPVRAADGSDARAPLKSVFRWDRTDLTALSAERLVADAGAKILPGRIAGARLERLEQLKVELTGQGLKPPNAQVAAWTPRIAAHLHATSAPAAAWDAFYRDLAQVFRWEAGLLERRAIIFDAENRLLPAGAAQGTGASARVGGSSSPTVFFSPRRERTYGEEEVDAREDLTIPPALRPFITYTHPHLTWTPAPGRAEARELFARNKLVRKFERRELREYLRDLLAEERSDEVRAAALDLAYRLSRNAGDALEPRLDRMNLYVPTVGGAWIPATRACFSPLWGTPAAAALASYIEHASGISSYVAELRDRCVAPPNSWPTTVEDVASWMSFLMRAGVSDGLPPEERGDPEATFKPVELAWRPLAPGVAVSGPGAAEWLASVKDTRGAYPKHLYQLARRVPVLPGQEHYEQLTDSARAALAELIGHGLVRWPDSVFSVEVKKVHGYSDTVTLPSPLAVFLQVAPWVRTISADGEKRYLRASEVWLPVESGDPLPSFVPQPARGLRSILATPAASARMTGRLGAGRWADPAFVGREVRSLAAWLASRPLTATQLHSLESSYRRAWRSITERGWQAALGTEPGRAPLIVRRAGQLVCEGADVSTDAGDHGPVYISDEGWGLRSHILESLGRPIFDPDLPPAQVPAAMAAARELAGIEVRRVSSLRPVVLVGGTAFNPDSGLARLVTGRLAWLGEFVALLLEVEGSGSVRSRVQRERAVEHLLRVRIRTAADVTIRIDEDVIALPDTTGGVLALQDSAAPTILLPPRLAMLDRSALPGLARPIAELLEDHALAGPLELALSRLARVGEAIDADEPPSAEEISRWIGVSPSRLAEIRASLRTSISALLTKLRPVICYIAGPDAAMAFGGADESFQAASDVARALEEYGQVLPLSPVEIVSACADSQDLEEVRDRLGLDYAKFNGALRALAPSYAPIHHRQEQLETFARYKERNEAAILAALRQGHLPAFRAAQALTVYVGVRSLATLTADPGWLDLCRVPSEEMMRACVSEWLSAHGGASGGEITLAPVEEVRAQVRELVRRLGGDFEELLPAWCHARGRPIPTPWMSEDAGNALATLAFDQGWTDFEPLAVEAVVERLRAAGAWPGEMLPTADASVLGLSAEDLRWRQEEAARERERREEARYTVTLNGQLVSSAPHRQRDFVQSVLASVTEADLETRPDIAKLQPVADGGPGGDGGGGGQRRGVQRRPTEAQRDAIGYAGELIAMRWIERHFGVDAASCWKSEYGDRYLGRSGGSDSLGYDFEIKGARPTLVEVKASVGEEMEISLGETQVRTAYDFRSERKAQYRILYLSHVLDSANRKIHMLPNPFSRRGHDLFRVLGQGMRFAFEVRRR